MTDPFNQTLMTLSRAERKQKLIDRYGHEFYDMATDKARTGIVEMMLLMGIDDPTQAALAFASALQDENPDEDLTTIIQFVMCAAADMTVVPMNLENAPAASHPVSPLFRSTN